jgi:hypothetical protein
LAEFYENQERYKEAEQLWKEELAGHRATEVDTGFETLNAICSLAELYEELERYEEAELLRKELLAGRRATEGDTGFETLNAICSLAELYEKLERYAEAEQLRRELPADWCSSVGDTPSNQAKDNVKQEDYNPGSVEAGSIPDPGGDPTYNPRSLDTSRPSLAIRPQSPFSMRSAFGNTPNSWSMF